VPAPVDEDGLEVGWLAALNRAAVVRGDILACLRRQQIGVMAAEHLGVRLSGGSFCGCVHVHEPAVDVVHARGNHEAVDQPEVPVLQGVGHRAHMVYQPFTMRQQRRREATQTRERSGPLRDINGD